VGEARGAVAGERAVDLRWSFDRLAGVVTGRLGRDVRGRAVFVFFGKSKSAMEALYFDGTGLCLFYKRPMSSRGLANLAR
jgi:transposase